MQQGKHSRVQVFESAARFISLQAISSISILPIYDLKSSTTLLYGSVLQSLFWLYSTVYKKRRESLSVPVRNPSLQIHWSMCAALNALLCSLATIMTFAWTKLEILYSKAECSCKICDMIIKKEKVHPQREFATRSDCLVVCQ